MPVLKAIRDSNSEGFQSKLIEGVADLTTRRTFARNTVCAAACAIAGYVAAPAKTQAFGAGSRSWNNKAIVEARIRALPTVICPAYCDLLVGVPAASGQRMRLSTTVLRVQNDKIAEQIGLDNRVTAALQLGLTGAAW